MKQFLSLLGGLALAIAPSTLQAQIDWAAGAPGGTSGGSIEVGDGGTVFLETGIAAALVGGNRTDGGLDYTVSAWINSTIDDGAGNAGGGQRWWFGTGNQGLHLGTLNANLRHGHWSADNSGTSVVPANTWVHATYAYDADGGTFGDGAVTIYFNGVSDGTFDAIAPNVSNTDLIIGSRDGVDGPGWVGFIDDVAIFTSALSAADVAALASDSSQAVSLGAAAYYNFEDPQTGTTAANLVSVAASGLTGTDGSPALQELDGIGAELPPVADWTTGAPGGTPGGAVLFDGSGVLETGIAAAIVGGNRTDGGLDYTVSAWFNTPEDDGSGNAGSQIWWFGTGNQGLHLGLLGTNLRHGHWSADNSGTSVVPSNTWVHATYAYDADGGTFGDGAVTIYFNGVSDGTFDAIAPNNSSTDLIIGGRNGGGSWIGSVDDVAIFTSALSAADVATLAADTTQAVALGAAAYYNFEDDQTGSTASNLVSVAASGLTGSDGSPAFQSLDGIGASDEVALKGDVDRDGVVDFGDIPAFVAVLQSGDFQAEADCDCSTQVNFGDIPAFIQILQNQ